MNARAITLLLALKDAGVGQLKRILCKVSSREASSKKKCHELGLNDRGPASCHSTVIKGYSILIGIKKTCNKNNSGGNLIIKRRKL